MNSFVQHVQDSLFINDSYRGVIVPKVWVMTSKCVGKECVSKLVANPKRVAIKDVMEYQNCDVEARICHDLGCSLVVAKGIFEDLKKFLWLAGHGSTHDMIPTPIIDEGWHCFILFTEDYANFCEKYFGTFIHHTAHRVGEPRSDRADLVPTINAMNDLFGGLPSSNWHYVSVESLVSAA